MKIRKYFINEFGGPDVLALVSTNLGAPSENEVQVQVEAIGINYIDIYRREGKLAASQDLPIGIGVEGVGTITEVGTSVKHLQIGDRVACIGNDVNSYASHFNFDAQRTVKLPCEMSSQVAAGTLFKGLTVEYLINRCYTVSNSDVVVWHAAAGGVGQIAIQWLKSLGATVIGTVSTERKMDTAYGFGCDKVLLSDDLDLAEKIRAFTGGGGVDVVYDSIGKKTFKESLRCLKPRGTMVLFGNTSGAVVEFDVSTLGKMGSLYLTRPTITDYTNDIGEFQEGLNEVLQAYVDGRFKIDEISCYSLEAASHAHKMIQDRRTVGSSVLLT